jgi:hypothetical protein
MLVSSVLMFFVACLLNIVAVAAPYWTGSLNVHGAIVNSAASLWASSTSVEGSDTEHTVDMCGDQMQNSNFDCGKIHAMRFFVITALLLAFASGSALLFAFSPALKSKQERRPTFCVIGGCLAAVTFIGDFIAWCIALSVDMPQPYSLNGAGFVFLIFSLMFNIGGVVIIMLVVRSKVTTIVTTVVSIGAAKADTSKEQQSATNQKEHVEKMPNLLVVSSSEKQASAIGNRGDAADPSSTLDTEKPMQVEDALC